jgi:hypothetical protein
VQRLHAPAANVPPDRLFDDTKSPIDSALEGGVLSSDDDARQSAEDYLHQADLVGPAAWSVHVGNTDADTFDGLRKLREFRTELSADVGLVIGVELDAEHSHVDQREHRVSTGRFLSFWLFDHSDCLCTSRASL